MGLLEMLVRNARSHAVRSLLTVVGIGLGIATVVALGAVVEGMRSTAGDFIRLGNTDLMVAQRGASDFSFSTLEEAAATQVEAVPGIAETTPFLLTVDRVGTNSFFMTIGIPAERMEDGPVQLASGRPPRDGTNELLLGTGSARDLGIEPGAVLEVGRNSWKVVGTYSAAEKWLGNGAVAPLDTLQEVSGRAGSITGLLARVDAGQDPVVVGSRVEDEFEDFSSLARTSDYSKVDQGFAIVDAVNAALSVLAVGIGAIGVMNTMFMSVFERTREIGVLRALGWRRRRVLQLVIGESLLLCLVGAVVGSALGVLAGWAINQIDTVAALMDITYPPELFIRGIAIGIVVGLLGASVPAMRATRLSPMEALRHE